MSTNTSKSGSKPVYTDKENEIAVFLDTRTITRGDNAGKSFEIYSYVQGKGDTQNRIEVPTKCGGYELSGEEAAELVNGVQLCRVMPNKTTEGQHHILIAPLRLDERQPQGSVRVFKSLRIVAALAEMPILQKDQDPQQFEKIKHKPRAFLIPSIDSNTKKESSKRDLKCYTTIIGKDSQGKSHYIPLYVADAYAARDRIASGTRYPFAFDRELYGKKFRIQLEGITTLEKAKTPTKVMKFQAFCLSQTQGRGNSHTLSSQSSQGRR
jgi:hypothetical protein